MIITLSEKWIAKAKAVGAARYAYATANGIRHYGNMSDAQEEKHIAGTIAEVAVAKHLRLPWLGKTGEDNLTGADVGDLVEVRARRVPGTGRDLAIRPVDKCGKPYILAHVYPDDSVDLVGWLYPEEAQALGVWNELKGVWFVPPPYRHLGTLPC